MGRTIAGKFLMGLTAVTGAALATNAILSTLNRLSLGNKVALITGSSRGLGFLIARELASEGAKVVICARDEKELKSAAEEISSITRNFHIIQCDITNKDEVRRMIRETEEVFGPVDVLINNAGIMRVGPMETMEEEDYELAMKVHFWGPYYVIREVLPSMISKKEGRIVNIVSIGGKVSFPHLLPYNVSKYALSGLSEGMTAELGKNHVKVTTVYPGLMQTGSPRHIDVKGEHEKEYAWFKISSSLPMISMNAEKAARQIVKAMKLGQKTLTLSIPAKLAIALHGVFPDLNITFFDLVNRLLPYGRSKEMKKGYESDSELSSTPVTEKTDKAAVETHEK